MQPTGNPRENVNLNAPRSSLKIHFLGIRYKTTDLEVGTNHRFWKGDKSTDSFNRAKPPIYKREQENPICKNNDENKCLQKNEVNICTKIRYVVFDFFVRDTSFLKLNSFINKSNSENQILYKSYRIFFWKAKA